MATQKTVVHQIGARALGYYGLMASVAVTAMGSHRFASPHAQIPMKTFTRQLRA